jgi:hypothetical protein
MRVKERRRFGERAIGRRVDFRHLRHALRLPRSAVLFSLLASLGAQAQEPARESPRVARRRHHILRLSCPRKNVWRNLHTR